MKPNVLVVSGGSNRGIAMLGALHHLHENGHLESITTYIGVSVGSVIATLLSIGLEPLYLFRQLKILNLFQDNSEIGMDSIISIFQKFGIYDPKLFIDTIKNILIEHLDTVPTMEELYEMTGVDLIIGTTNINKMQAVYIDHNTHPSMLCTQAIRMSISIPFIFTPVSYEGDLYVDGAISGSFPINHLDFEPNRIIGVCCNKQTMPLEIKDPIQFMIYSSQTSISELTRVVIQHCSERCTIIDIDVGELASHLEFIPPTPIANQLFALGVACARTIIQ